MGLKSGVSARSPADARAVTGCYFSELRGTALFDFNDNEKYDHPILDSFNGRGHFEFRRELFFCLLNCGFQDRFC